jgi:hypothetical protein
MVRVLRARRLDLAAALYAAFDVAVSYRQEKQQATVRATITDATPAIIRALITDPRTTDPRPITASVGNSTPVAIAADIEFPNTRPARHLTIEVAVNL